MNTPKVTVIVPVYKVENYLARCLDSILGQSYFNLEVIIVNDGSPDKCPEICDSYKENDNRIKVIHQRNQGLSMARNNGMKLATGQYVSFIDSDDYIEKDMYKKMVNAIIKHNLKVVECSMNLSGKVFYEQDPNKIVIETIDDALMRSKHPGFNSAINKLYDYDLIKEIPFKKGKLYEDIIFNSEVWQKIDRIGFTPMAFYINPQQGESIQRSGYNLNKVEGLWVIHEAVENFLRLASKKKAKDTIKSTFLDALIFHFHSLLEVKHLDSEKKHLRKMYFLIRKYSGLKFKNVFFSLINILPLPLYEQFFLLNKFRHKLLKQKVPTLV